MKIEDLSRRLLGMKQGPECGRGRRGGRVSLSHETNVSLQIYRDKYVEGQEK